MTDLEPLFYNITELSFLIGLSVATIRHHLNRENLGAIPRSIKVGKHRRWFRKDVMDWVADLRRSPS